MLAPAGETHYPYSAFAGWQARSPRPGLVLDPAWKAARRDVGRRGSRPPADTERDTQLSVAPYRDRSSLALMWNMRRRLIAMLGLLAFAPHT